MTKGKSQIDGTVNFPHHSFLLNMYNGTYALKEMLQQPDKWEFVKAMEVSDHEGRGY